MHFEWSKFEASNDDINERKQKHNHLVNYMYGILKGKINVTGWNPELLLEGKLYSDCATIKYRWGCISGIIINSE